MSNLLMWSYIVGFFLPLVLAVVQQPRWPDPVRAIIMFLACIVASVGTTYFQGEVTFKRWVEAGLAILVTTISTYKGLWKPTMVAPEIETVTSPGSRNPSA